MLRQLRRQLLIAGLSLAAVVVVVLAIGSPATSAEVPAPGGVYVEGVVGHPAYLNPLLSPFNDADQDVVSLVFSGLTRLAPDGSVVPDLARDWSVSPDGRVYTFHLRDATWQDGQPVTADDVVFTVGQIQSPAFPGSPEMARLWHSVKVVKIDRQTVQFRLAEPYAPFLQYTTLGLLPSHLLAGTTGRALTTTPFNAQPVGSGPFEVQSASLQEIVLVRNPRYYGRRPYLDGITFRYFDSFQAADAAFQQGDVQGLGNVPPDHVLDLANDPRINLQQAPEYAKLNLLMLNTQAPLFSDDVVRRAIDLAIDRSKLIQVAADGEGAPAAGPIMPESWAFVPQTAAYSYEPGQAVRLLDQAGWILPSPGAVREKDGKPFRFVLLAVNEPDRLRTAQEISRQLRLVGIEADVQTADWRTIVQNFLAPRRFDAVLTEMYSPTADPDPYPFWHSSQIKQGLNIAGWSNRIADQLLADARKQEDRRVRADDYARFQSLFAQEQPAILLYYPVYAYALPSPLKGVTLGLLTSPSDRFESVTSWYLRTRPGGSTAAGAAPP